MHPVLLNLFCQVVPYFPKFPAISLVTDLKFGFSGWVAWTIWNHITQRWKGSLQLLEDWYFPDSLEKCMFWVCLALVLLLVLANNNKNLMDFNLTITKPHSELRFSRYPNFFGFLRNNRVFWVGVHRVLNRSLCISIWWIQIWPLNLKKLWFWRYRWALAFFT